MSGPSWERREPNRATWSFVGALLSTLYVAAMYGLPLWRFIVDWLYARPDWDTATAGFGAHAALVLAYGVLGALQFIYTWSTWMSRTFLHAASAMAAVVVMVAGAAVTNVPGPVHSTWMWDYRGWVWLMVFIATVVAVFDITQIIARFRGRASQT